MKILNKMKAPTVALKDINKGDYFIIIDEVYVKGELSSDGSVQATFLGFADGRVAGFSVGNIHHLSSDRLVIPVNSVTLILE